MKTLYLHIGSAKTGSTAIQHFLFENEELLKSYSFCFPIFKYKFGSGQISRNGSFLCTYYGKIGEIDKIRNEEIVEEYLDNIVKLFETYDNVILSEESLLCNLGNGDWKKRADKLLECVNKNNFEIKIIVYLRRQDEMLDSHWNSVVKMATQSLSFEEFKKSRIELEQYDYFKHLERIGSIFGRDKIIVRRFQTGELIGDSSVSDFLQVIGLNDLDKTSKETTMQNPRFSNNMIVIKRFIDSYSEASKKGKKISRKALTKSLSVMEECESYNNYESSMLSEEEAREFVNIFKDSNKKVAEKYIGDGKPLFNDVYKNKPKWEFENPSMMRDFIQATCAMFGEMMTTFEEYDKRLKKQNARIKKLELQVNGKRKSIIHKIIKNK